MLQGLKRAILSRFNYTLKQRESFGGLKIPVINDVGRAHLDAHEPHLQILLQRLHEPGSLLIDVGVNIGQTLVKYASVAGRDCRYIGFEPNAKAASYVDEIVIRNSMPNAVIVPVGLGSSTRLATLFMSSPGGADPAASINEEVRDSSFYGAKRVVPIFDGDSALAELGVTGGRIILKIDVEGAELEVVTGLKKTLDALRPFVILEILPPANFSSTVNDYRLAQAERLKAFLAERNYACYAVGERGELSEGESATNDYLFVPAERVAELG